MRILEFVPLGFLLWMRSGMPWDSIRSANTSIASLARMRRAT
jgi:hypothetical protein